MTEIGILIIDDDAASQGAIKNVLDSEGFHVRIVPSPSDAMKELASGAWSLVIVNVTLLDLHGPLFAILKELAQAHQSMENPAIPQRQIRVLFLMPQFADVQAQRLIERENLPYTVTPYHLHDFLEKVSDLLVEAGAMATRIRGNLLEERKRRTDRRVSRNTRPGAMFASRDEYQMTEEEMNEFERQEEDDRKKREKEKNRLYH
jgi:DNA-binding response OmpR family regulator